MIRAPCHSRFRENSGYINLIEFVVDNLCQKRKNITYKQRGAKMFEEDNARLSFMG